MGEIDSRLPQIGAVVASKYRIERVLGMGGMGVVYAAKHEMLGQDVALKMLLPEVAKDKEAVARFLHEGRATARLQSDHVVRVMDVGVEGTTPFLAMELLDGEDLGQMLEKGGALKVMQTVDYLVEAMEGLSHAHAARIIHRDLKPSNLFLARGEGATRAIKVVDFGISKSMGTEAGITATSAVLGSPAYMAPEQLRSSKHVDARVDVWSLGVIAFELLTGQLPFGGETVGEIFANVLEKPPARPRTLRIEVPGKLEEAILKCLQKSADARYPNVAELAKEIARFGTPKSDALVASIESKLASIASSAPIRSMSIPDLEIPIAPVTSPKVTISASKIPSAPISAPTAAAFDFDEEEMAAAPSLVTVDEVARRPVVTLPPAASATITTSRRPPPPSMRFEWVRESLFPFVLHVALAFGAFYALQRFVPAHRALDVFSMLPGTTEGSAARTSAIVGAVFAAICIGACIVAITSGAAKWGFFVTTLGFGAMALGLFLVMGTATGGVIGVLSGERMFVVIGSTIVSVGLAFAFLGKARDAWRDDDARTLPPLLAIGAGVLLFAALELVRQPLI